ncbi:hypothetical protein NEIRO03_2323, partial [Nematocida sp. AWRm78]
MTGHNTCTVTRKYQETADESVCRSQEREVVEVLECITRKHPDTLGVHIERYSGVQVIESILMHWGTVVFELHTTLHTQVAETRILREVLQACREGVHMQTGIRLRMYCITLSYSDGMAYNPFIIHVLFTYYVSIYLSLVYLTVCSGL